MINNVRTRCNVSGVAVPAWIHSIVILRAKWTPMNLK